MITMYLWQTFQCFHLPTNARIQAEISYQVNILLHVINCDHLHQR